MELSQEQKFEALKLRYQDQVELLRTMTMVDIKIFSGYITLQLILSAWLAKNPIKELWTQIGLLSIIIVVAGLTIKLLYNNYRRRKEVVLTLQNVNNALGFNTDGIYISEKINAPTTFRPWSWWYIIGVIVSLIGVSMVLFVEISHVVSKT